jgi:UDP-N-acetylglucosamine--N-acetylmuramyl-(pentapeptide) pyrophosphoryl-undecaprenol N-acetylglucosamine transferase
MSPLRLLFACGGTSGHITPALAIAEQVRADHPDADICFCGTARGLESEIVPRAGFPFVAIRARGFPNKPSLELIRALADYAAGRQQCRQYLRSFRPNAVIGTGGYVAGPVVSAAHSLGIPVLLHEQNAFPGRSNRVMARKSQAICVSFPGSEKYFPAGAPVTLTGNPVREVFFRISRAEARRELGFSDQQVIVLAMGGSQGARSINDAVLGLDFPAIFPDRTAGQASTAPLLILAAGKKNFAAVQAAAAGKDWLSVREYIHDVHLYMAAADMVINRAGASTCAELAALGRPAILIPYPFAAGDHQTFNARVMADAGAAVPCPAGELNPTKLKQILKTLIQDTDALARMGCAAAALAQPGAADAICKRLYEIAQ